MTYNVFGGMLNLAQSINWLYVGEHRYLKIFCVLRLCEVV